MRLLRICIVCLAALALLASPAMACPPIDDGGGSFSFGGGYGADMCEAPMVAGNFGAGYGGGASFAAPSYSASFAAPVYHVQTFAAPRVYAAPVVQQRVVAAPVYGYGSFDGRRFGGSFRGGYGSAVVAAPVRVRVRSFAAPAYGAPVVAAPVVAVPVRTPGPIRGAVRGFFGGLRNKLNGF